MKNIFFLLLATILLGSCQDDDDYHYEWPSDEIAFPDEGIHGLNVLNENTTEFKTRNDSISQPWYSLMASVPYNTTLKLEIENTTKDSERLDFYFGGLTEWKIHPNSIDANNNTQVLVL